MSAIYELICAAILLGWCASRLLMLALPDRRAVWVGYGGAGMIILFAHHTMPLGFFVALFAPFGVLLPALALQNSARVFGFNASRYRRRDIIVFLAIYLAFLAASAGVVDWHPYSYGYDAFGAAVVALVLAVFALWRGYVVVLAVVVTAQILWLAGIGSSNFFDQISHVLLIFVLPISALRNRT